MSKTLGLKKVTTERPKAWEQMKDFHDHNGQEGLPSWPDWCYAPMAASFAVASKGEVDTLYEKMSLWILVRRLPH